MCQYVPHKLPVPTGNVNTKGQGLAGEHDTVSPCWQMSLLHHMTPKRVALHSLKSCRILINDKIKIVSGSITKQNKPKHKNSQINASYKLVILINLSTTTITTTTKRAFIAITELKSDSVTHWAFIEHGVYSYQR